MQQPNRDHIFWSLQPCKETVHQHHRVGKVNDGRHSGCLRDKKRPAVQNWGFPGGSVVKKKKKSLPVNARDAGGTGSVPGSRRSPGGGHGSPLQYTCLENPKDRGAWWATVYKVAKSQTWLSNWINTVQSYNWASQKEEELSRWERESAAALVQPRQTAKCEGERRWTQLGCSSQEGKSGEVGKETPQPGEEGQWLDMTLSSGKSPWGFLSTGMTWSHLRQEEPGGFPEYILQVYFVYILNIPAMSQVYFISCFTFCSLTIT